MSFFIITSRKKVRLKCDAWVCNQFPSFRGVFVLPTPKFHEIDEPKLELEPTEFQDTKFFEIKKFFKLCGKGSPNQLELLFSQDVRGDAYLNYFEINKSVFLGKHDIYNAHVGYAKSEWVKWAYSENPKALRKIRHVFRLLDQCSQLLSTGTMNPRLNSTMVEFLNGVKSGEFPWEELDIVYQTRLDAVWKTYTYHCVLPQEADWSEINSLLRYARSCN